MTTPPAIRLARPSEYASIGELTVLAYADVLHNSEADHYRAVLLDAKHRAEAAELWVAVDSDDCVLGTVTVGRPGSAYADVARPGEIEVRMLAVHPGHARRGIGRVLMAHVHTIAARDAFTGTALSVIATNAAATNFYAALGYRRAPHRDWRPSENLNFQLLVYVRPLGP